jgi:hypothetical protein
VNAPLQGTESWALARSGCATASCFSDVLAEGQGKTRAKYLRRVLAERLIGKPIETYHNGHMDRGNELEPLARMAYEAETGALVDEVGFIPHPTIQWCGCSPDGLVGDDGGIEAKSVIATIQVETILRGDYPPEHRPQVQGNLWVTKRQWWDFCSYCPDMPEHLQLYVFRVVRDEDYIAALERKVLAFLKEVETLHARLMDTRTLYDKLLASVEQNTAASQP